MTTPSQLRKADEKGLLWACVPPKRTHPFPDMATQLWNKVNGTWHLLQLGHPLVIERIVKRMNEDEGVLIPPPTEAKRLMPPIRD